MTDKRETTKSILYSHLAWKIRTENVSQQHLLLWLAAVADKYGCSHHSYKSIQKYTGYSQTTISNALKYLQKIGALSWQKGHGKRHQGTANQYQLHLDRMRELAEIHNSDGPETPSSEVARSSLEAPASEVARNPETPFDEPQGLRLQPVETKKDNRDIKDSLYKNTSISSSTTAHAVNAESFITTSTSYPKPDIPKPTETYLYTTDIYSNWSKEDVDAFIEFYGEVLNVKSYRRNRDGIHNWKLKSCPWCGHSDCKISLGYIEGKITGLAFTCFSPSNRECGSDLVNNKFKVLREKLEDDTGRKYSMYARKEFIPEGQVQ